MAGRHIKIFPYQISWKNPTDFNIGEIFSPANLKKNILKLSEDASNVFVVDRPEGDFRFGRFIKLRQDVPSVLNIETAIESDI
ncbi:MAG: hypothetical protein WCB79_06385, partial [Halobacteriota archaeon]